MTDHNSLARAAHVARASDSAVAASLEALRASLDALADATGSVSTASMADLNAILGQINAAADGVAVAAVDIATAVASLTSPPASSLNATPAPAPAAAPAPAPALPAPAPAAPAAPVFHTTGPWIAGRLFSIPPLEPLQAVPDNGERWFAITRGRYVGLTNNGAISLNATTGISGGLGDRLASQALALQYFNAALDANAVVVTQI
ncbi:hypothetical protein C8R47DRAFT_1219806 [Mycena vitilis]|nr:hypothetical protein C8R47DRAFT_1219806 [Mycena vitilis]